MRPNLIVHMVPSEWWAVMPSAARLYWPCRHCPPTAASARSMRDRKASALARWGDRKNASRQSSLPPVAATAATKRQSS